MYNSLETLKAAEFTGFKTVEELWNDHSIIPNQKGVYIIINPKRDSRKFLDKGVGGFFKQKDPNVSLSILSDKWIDDCFVVYIGQAGGNGSTATLRKRLKQYIDFGNGKPVGHYGGRYIWQIKHHPELLIAWKILLNDDPKIIEGRLIKDFTDTYGKKPFANIIN